MKFITPYNSTRGFPADLFEEMDQLLNAFRSPTYTTEKTFHPATEITEQDGHYLLSIDVPGIRKDDIKINVTDNVLTVSGERKREEKTEDSKVRRVERSYGSFKRSFTLPNTIDADQIEAHYEDGVLELSLPKAPTAQAKTIEIKSGKSGFFNKLLGSKKEQLVDKSH